MHIRQPCKEHVRAKQQVAHLNWPAEAHAAASSVDHAHAVNIILLHMDCSQSLTFA